MKAEPIILEYGDIKFAVLGPPALNRIKVQEIVKLLPKNMENLEKAAEALTKVMNPFSPSIDHGVIIIAFNGPNIGEKIGSLFKSK